MLLPFLALKIIASFTAVAGLAVHFSGLHALAYPTLQFPLRDPCVVFYLLNITLLIGDTMALRISLNTRQTASVGNTRQTLQVSFHRPAEISEPHALKRFASLPGPA
jgi:hypothetical protein